jgi:hypothetical protein
MVRGCFYKVTLSVTYYLQIDPIEDKLKQLLLSLYLKNNF